MTKHTIGAIAPTYFFHLTVPRIRALGIEPQALQQAGCALEGGAA